MKNLIFAIIKIAFSTILGVASLVTLIFIQAYFGQHFGENYMFIPLLIFYGIILFILYITKFKFIKKENIEQKIMENKKQTTSNIGTKGVVYLVIFLVGISIVLFLLFFESQTELNKYKREREAANAYLKTLNLSSDAQKLSPQPNVDLPINEQKSIVKPTLYFSKSVRDTGELYWITGDPTTVPAWMQTVVNSYIVAKMSETGETFLLREQREKLNDLNAALEAMDHIEYLTQSVFREFDGGYSRRFDGLMLKIPIISWLMKKTSDGKELDLFNNAIEGYLPVIAQAINGKEKVNYFDLRRTRKLLPYIFSDSIESANAKVKLLDYFLLRINERRVKNLTSGVKIEYSE